MNGHCFDENRRTSTASSRGGMMHVIPQSTNVLERMERRMMGMEDDLDNATHKMHTPSRTDSVKSHTSNNDDSPLKSFVDIFFEDAQAMPSRYNVGNVSRHRDSNQNTRTQTHTHIDYFNKASRRVDEERLPNSISYEYARTLCLSYAHTHTRTHRHTYARTNPHTRTHIRTH